MNPFFDGLLAAFGFGVKLQPGDIIIDISHHNGIVNFEELVKNVPQIKGVLIKASEGANSLNTKFYTNVEGCERVKLPWSAYHFATWNNEDEEFDARQEAKFFISVVKGAGKKVPKLPLVLDVESNGPIPYTTDEMKVYVSTFLAEIRAAKFEPAIYGSPGFLNLYFAKDHPFTDVKLMVADYTGSINPVPGWSAKNIWLHQFTENGIVRGVPTKCDMSRVIMP